VPLSHSKDYANAFTGVRTNPRVGAIAHWRSRPVSCGTSSGTGTCISAGQSLYCSVLSNGDRARAVADPFAVLASLLNELLLGYAVIELTSEFQQNREDFLENLVELFLHGAVSQSESIPSSLSGVK